MKSAIVLTITLTIGATSSSVVLANDDTQKPTHDAYGAVIDRTIIAGVLIADNETEPDSPSCNWQATLARDTGQGAGSQVTKELDAVNFRLYSRQCNPQNENITTLHWIAEVSPDTIAHNSANVVYDLIPALFGEFAPPARQGLINIGTWFWVRPEIWQPKSVTAWVPTASGPIIVTTTATPTQLLFMPGDGIFGTGQKSCLGPGLRWTKLAGDQVMSPCMYEYRHSSAISPSGLFAATLSIIWRVTWRANTGASGSLPNVTTSALNQIKVREFQALVTS